MDKREIPKFVCIILIVPGCADILRGIMHVIPHPFVNT